ncbi:MAG: methionyl-tRNA formyltransferase [Eubacteriales bacterium]|nr:methionyl-tRNA formyltransferase [Eubacteriales bacterium]
MRIVFLGTPDFAVPSLQALVQAGHEVVGVFTQPDRPQGRSQKMIPCPVKATAQQMSLPVFQFEKIRRREGYEALLALQPDVMVTAAFGQILTQRILDIPPMGCVNVHASLLPKYRGAAPIQWSVIKGEAVTGVTTMLTAAGIDTGDILLQRQVEILPQETAGELFDRLAPIGASLLVETLAAMQDGAVVPRPQCEAEATHFPILSKEDGQVDFSQTAAQVHDLVRGVDPWPGAWVKEEDGSVLKIWKTRVDDAISGQPGAVIVRESRMWVCCAQQAVELLEVQAPGKRRMPVADYLRGHMPEKGKVFHYAR